VAMLERMRAYSLDDVLATRKRKDSWWTVFLVDPVACRLTLLVANHTSITPNGLTRFSLILGMCSAICFASGRLAAGALLFYVSFMVDCMDGKVARLKGTGTAFGLWLDYVGDRIRVLCCAAGLASGQYVATGDVDYILLGTGVAVLDLFRYVNAPQMKRVREVVRENRLGQPPAEPVVTVGSPGAGEAPLAAGHAVHAGHLRSVEIVAPREPLRVAGFEDRGEARGENRGEGRAGRQGPRGGRRPRLPRRFTRLLARHRVRTHLISGIEFHAAVFVVAPLIGTVALVPLAVAAGVLLLLNEVVLIYRMWLFARVVPVVPLVGKAPRIPV